MDRAKPIVACVGLAVAAHAALLLPPTAPGSARDTAGAARQAMTVRVQAAESVAPVGIDPAPALPATEQLPAAQAIEAAAAEAAQSRTPSDADVPPAFAELPAIGFADAPLPEDGASIRAYLTSDAEGAVATVSTAAPPQLPVGFQKMVELGLRQSRLQAGTPAAYCLLVRFDPAAPEPTLAWLPGAAQDAARCLAGALPAPREITTAISP